MGFNPVVLAWVRSANVLLACNWLQVAWSNTGFHTTEMVYLETFRNFYTGQFQAIPMGIHLLIGRPKLTITSGFSGCP